MKCATITILILTAALPSCVSAPQQPVDAAPPSLSGGQTCAAIIRDDFDADWDTSLWTPWIQDDNMRIYRRPENAPARFVLIRPPFPGFPFRGARMALLDESGAAVAKGKTDRDGEAALTLPSNRLYPMGGKLVVSFQGETVGVLDIQARGVEGLYPGDIWKIGAPAAYTSDEEGYPQGV